MRHWCKVPDKKSRGRTKMSKMHWPVKIRYRKVHSTYFMESMSINQYRKQAKSRYHNKWRINRKLAPYLCSIIFLSNRSVSATFNLNSSTAKGTQTNSAEGQIKNGC